ncbi:peptide chain release factor N(5)-glutamine methyltransferase [Virgibacillus oceani]|uniref:Release factor glutamine methyltransferase n=1 Tax=Virgibacillus oceani TaxID=1479511 RepID=A0A917MC20_9BACI|nr:peptide chain release factor N(5)-glutamine methyltransferase [Virgibacillus oceani]GGG87895.1 release factor glutamine methyltransferase [Virgibacillus oceani]
MDKPMKQYEVLQWASLFLEKHNRETRVAELLLQHYLNVTRSHFFMTMREPVPNEIVQEFQKAIKEHAETGIPIQHLTGCEMFYGRTFAVNKHVLIPRPETEELVQHVIKLAKLAGKPITIADIGTGSGIIAATLALELENATVYATDISKDALNVAKNNAKQLHSKITFLQGDLLQPLIHNKIKADIIVSNPPYIAREDAAIMQDTVKAFDPELALFAEENGLAAYKQIIANLPQVLKEDAYAAFEIGYQQGEAVKTLLKEKFPESEVQIHQDINKKDRIITAKIKNY